MHTTIGDFLFARLRQLGVSKVFGVPGDFNLQLLEQLARAEGIEFVGCCNELNAAYAADGYARTNGMGALLTTYGVGDLSAVCGIAGACAEHVPVVFLSGTPPLYAMESRLRVHHSLAEGNFDNIRNCLREFTAADTRLTPYNAVDEIDRAFETCWREKLPVFVQIPSDISYLTIESPQQPLQRRLPKSDPERLQSAADRIVALLDRAEHPVLLVDMDADRSRIAGELERLVQKRQIPYAAFRTGKAILSEQNALFLGTYNGKSSAPSVGAAIEHSDCLMATAPCYTEGSPMVFPEGVPVAAHVYIRGFSVTIEDSVYEGVTANELIERMTALVAARAATVVPDAQPVPCQAVARPGEKLRHEFFWPRLQHFFRKNDVVLAENGTSAIAMGSVPLPEGASYLSQQIWGSIGFTLPALMGSMMAAPERRHILLIGDGSFQLTVQELSTILQHGLKPIIFLVNNGGYTIERYILGRQAKYNEIAPWNYTALPKAFAPDAELLTAQVRSEEELEGVLQRIEREDRAALIELIMDKLDAPEALKSFGPKVAEMDYGPRGPQRN